MKQKSSTLDKILMENRILFHKQSSQMKKDGKIKDQINKMETLLKQYDEDNRLLSLKLKQINIKKHIESKERINTQKRVIQDRKHDNKSKEQHSRNKLNNTQDHLNYSLTNRWKIDDTRSLKNSNTLIVSELDCAFNCEHSIIYIGEVKSMNFKTLLVSPRQKLFSRGQSIRKHIQASAQKPHSSNLKGIYNIKSNISTARQSQQGQSKEQESINNEQFNLQKLKKSTGRDDRRRYLSLTTLKLNQ